MRTRLLLAVLVALIAVPALADPPKPNLVFQFKPLDEFLESMPFPETRNYVKRVTMLSASYRRLSR